MEKATKTIMLKIDLETYQKMKELAQKEKRALQRQAEVLLEKALEEAEKQ